MEVIVKVMQIQFIVDGYILKGGYCLGSLFFQPLLLE